MLELFFFFTLICWTHAQAPAINVADVPQCARDCLTNSTIVVVDTCASLNVACLCNSPVFVSTFYCCLSTQCNTSEQATAITFNQQQCAAVNTTAPDFVGCSPLKATSSAGGAKSATTVTPSSRILYSTVASIVSEPATFSMTRQSTATFAGQSLLVGTCTAPLFALVSATGTAEMFPQVGCAPVRQGCCPFDNNVNAVITKCPQDYITTANGCCPSGYSVFSRMIGTETPCYRTVSTVLVPGSTPTISGLSITTDHIFTKRYLLVTTQGNTLSAGGIAGITVVAIGLVVVTGIIMWWIRRRKTTQTNKSNGTGTTFPPEEPVLPPHIDPNSPQELASPEVMGYKTSFRSIWPLGGFLSSPTNEKVKPLPITKTIAPQELPGSTYMNEHHPAFSGSETTTALSGTGTPPRTPARSPVLSAAGSPTVTPIPEEYQARTLSPSIISPIGSPRFSRTITDHSMSSSKG